MITRPLPHHPASREDPGADGVAPPVRVPVVGALIALGWLSVAVLPATRPHQGGSSYLGAALVAVVAGAAIVMLTSALRQRAAAEGATLTDALAPVVCLAVGSVVLGGLAYAMADPSPVLQDAFTWVAELGGLATVIALVPLPASDGARALRIFLARRHTGEQVDAALARSVTLSGGAIIVAGFAVAAFLDIGLGILLVGLGWITLASSRLRRARRELVVTLTRLTAGDVVQPADSIPGWRTLSEVLADQREAGGGWPVGVSAIPVVDWSGALVGVLATAAAERALEMGRGDERVAVLAVPLALVPSVDVDAPAGSLVRLLAGTATNIAVVTRDRVPIGTVSAADLRQVARTARLRAGSSALKRLKAVGTTVGGVVLVIAGLALLVLPGPGLVVLAAGLAVLATRSPWLRDKLAWGFDRLPPRVQDKTPDKLVRILRPENAGPPTDAVKSPRRAAA